MNGLPGRAIEAKVCSDWSRWPDMNAIYQHRANSRIDEESQLTQWLLKLPKPVGVLACYDLRGRQLIEICQRNELAVPEQVAILGVDNDELVCNLAETPLSSIIPNAPWSRLPGCIPTRRDAERQAGRSQSSSAETPGDRHHALIYRLAGNRRR